MKLMHVEALVPVANLHDVMLFLEEKKAYNVKVSAFKNGSANESATQVTKKRSNDQVKWLVAHIKDNTEARNLKEGWVKAGFKVQSLYGALGRAVTQKLIKKTAAGVYKPVGGA